MLFCSSGVSADHCAGSALAFSNMPSQVVNNSSSCTTMSAIPFTALTIVASMSIDPSGSATTIFCSSAVCSGLSPAAVPCFCANALNESTLSMASYSPSSSGGVRAGGWPASSRSLRRSTFSSPPLIGLLLSVDGNIAPSVLTTAVPALSSSVSGVSIDILPSGVGFNAVLSTSIEVPSGLVNVAFFVVGSTLVIFPTSAPISSVVGSAPVS